MVAFLLFMIIEQLLVNLLDFLNIIAILRLETGHLKSHLLLYNKELSHSFGPVNICDSWKIMEKKNQLEQLREVTTIVCDSGDFEVMKAYKPRDATTNPTLILKATEKEEYAYIVDEVVQDNRSVNLEKNALIEHIFECLLVQFGLEILKIVPGRVSTETDAIFSFDVEESIAQARRFIKRYESKGIGRERVLIKLASTWEGAKAATVLQKEGIRCNMTLLFSLPQAVICAEAGAQLISPFVGRIYDWYKAFAKKDYHGADDPGVQSVQKVYNYYKKFDYRTEIMGASFRYKDQILELAGCDLLTISPQLLEELTKSTDPIPHKLTAQSAKASNIQKMELDEKSFRYLLNDDAMATEKLAEGIRVFAKDAQKLKDLIASKL